MGSALGSPSRLVKRLQGWLGPNPGTAKRLAVREAEPTLTWLRENNRPAQAVAELEKVEAELVKALASAPKHSVVRARLAGHAAIIAYRRGAVPELGVQNSLEAIHQIDEIARTGHLSLAKSLLDSYATKWPKSEPLQRLNCLMSGPGKDDGFDDRGDDFQIWRHPAGSETTLVVFTGLGDRFGTSLGQLHYAWLSALPANIIYLRDFERKLYLAGIRSIGNLEDTFQHLSETLTSLGTKKSTFLGHSGGVFGALYYAIHLGADMALCFSGTIDLDARSSESVLHKHFWADHQRGLIPWPDLREMLCNSSVKVHLYYGAANAVDAVQAKKLVGLPNVFLHPIEGRAKHFVLDDLAGRGELARIFFECCHVTQPQALQVES